LIRLQWIGCGSLAGDSVLIMAYNTHLATLHTLEPQSLEQLAKLTADDISHSVFRTIRRLQSAGSDDGADRARALLRPRSLRAAHAKS
jgi:hypothetical protein